MREREDDELSYDNYVLIKSVSRLALPDSYSTAAIVSIYSTFV